MLELYGCKANQNTTEISTYANTTVVEIELQTTPDYRAASQYGASVAAVFFNGAGEQLGAAAVITRERDSRFVQQAVLTGGVPCTVC